MFKLLQFPLRKVRFFQTLVLEAEEFLILFRLLDHAPLLFIVSYGMSVIIISYCELCQFLLVPGQTVDDSQLVGR